jgi:hypothetical protein
MMEQFRMVAEIRPGLVRTFVLKVGLVCRSEGSL